MTIVFERPGDAGDEFLCGRVAWNNWSGTQRKTVTLSAGDYMWASAHGEYGGGSRQDGTIMTPAGAGPTSRTIIKPLDGVQDGLWSVVELSNGKPVGTQAA